MSKPKVTILPPAEQDVFFQEIQFDLELPGRGGAEGMTNSAGRGTDPIRYANGKYVERQRLKKSPEHGSKTRLDRLKKAEKELAGHENKKAILKILTSGL